MTLTFGTNELSLPIHHTYGSIGRENSILSKGRSQIYTNSMLYVWENVQLVSKNNYKETIYNYRILQITTKVTLFDLLKRMHILVKNHNLFINGDLLISYYTLLDRCHTCFNSNQTIIHN